MRTIEEEQELRALYGRFSEIEKLECTRKYKDGLKYYIPNPMQFKAHKSTAKIILYCGGNRAGKCLGKETKVYDPVLGKELEVGKIDSAFHVLAYDGTGLRIAKAEKPFRKTIDKIYRVALSNGGEFTCSMSHVVLTPYGFRTISDVRVGDELFLPQTILEPFQSIRDEDVRNSYQKAEDSLFDYRSLLRLCDVQLLRVKDNGQDSVPLQDDAQVHTSSSVFLHMDGQDNKTAGTRIYQLFSHLSSKDGQSQNVAQPFGTLCDTSCTTLQSVGLNTSFVQKSIDESFYTQSKFSVDQYPRHDDSIHPSDSSCVVVKSISYIRNDYKWDFTVPIYHNYFASGAIHHNSTFGAVELAMHITGNYPDWYPYKRRFNRPIKAVVVATSNAIIQNVIEPKIWMYMPQTVIKSTKRVTGGYINKIRCVNGSTIDFLSGEQDDMSFESADYDFYWGDEPQKKRKFQALMRGLIDRGGQTVLTFTPLVEPWMKEDLVDRSDGKNIETFTVDMLDNRFDIEGNPILSQENIDFYTSTWDEETKETRMHGKFFHLRGQVYPMFSEIHQKDFDYKSDDVPLELRDPVIAVLDPHDRQPHHVIWAFIDSMDDIYVHDELSVACTVDELARKILDVEKRNKYRMKKRLIDPNFGRTPLVTTGRNFIQEMAVSGCGGWFEADDPKDEGRLKVKEYLSYNPEKPISYTNCPKLYFHKRNCPLTIHSIRNHQYEEWIGKTSDDKDPKEKTKDKDTHGADCVRYLCMSNPRYEMGSRISEYELAETPY